MARSNHISKYDSRAFAANRTRKGPWIRRHRLFYCDDCYKWSYKDKKSAKRVGRALHPDDSHISAYRCPANNEYWHYGHDYLRFG